MSKKLFLLIALMLSISLALLGCGKSATSSEKTSGDDDVYKLSFNVQIPATHKFHTDVVKPWADLVEKETNGRVQIEIYNSGALGTLATAYDDIKGGLYDIGYVSPLLHLDSDLYPLTIGDLPFGITDSGVKARVLGKLKDKYMMDAFNESTLLSISSTDSYQLYSKEPVESITDVEDTKIIVQGAERIETVKGWDAVPVSLGLEQIYESLEKNTVDQTTYTSVGALGLKLYEVAPYLTKIDLGATTLVFLQNSDSLNKMPDDLKQLFVEELGPKLGEMTGEMYKSEAEKAMNEYGEKVKGQGGKVITLDNAKLNEFKKPSKKIWDAWAKEANKKEYPGDEILEEFKNLIIEEGGTLPY
ncbi:TRAP transporter substrate-binding protein DctP [Bacillus sp. EB106-08-02-XG196]|uniref:TRAP transporter substrate-binding protein DctP n=1 Tax=Bacillus sp. EB106-08-02-XG196 TaxID=2737049 RepID=UPI0015C4A440|nr:TRAP transporter substrate-binding protein DctP [Bacillus sp. EB106-08-02-XG196]NWQ42568.1 TRAP transporter substrate-binding protein DctP [Bacillus sp. EB106-08-02-XG196]